MGLQPSDLANLTTFFRDLNGDVDRMLTILGRMQHCKCQSKVDPVEKWTKYDEMNLIGTDAERSLPDH